MLLEQNKDIQNTSDYVKMVPLFLFGIKEHFILAQYCVQSEDFVDLFTARHINISPPGLMVRQMNASGLSLID